LGNASPIDKFTKSDTGVLIKSKNFNLGSPFVIEDNLSIVTFSRKRDSKWGNNIKDFRSSGELCGFPTNLNSVV
jgi:hypothetical protein